MNMLQIDNRHVTVTTKVQSLNVKINTQQYVD